jgi:hypothetical protein
LDFLGRTPFPYENRHSGALDFLGFPRPNRDLSMGYEDKTQEFFLVRFSPRRRRHNRRQPLLAAEEQNCSWGKFNLISDSLQSIVVPAVSFYSLNPEAAH